MKRFLAISLLLTSQLLSIAQPAGTLIKWKWGPSTLQYSNTTVVTVAGEPMTNVTAVAIGGANLALKSDGTVAGWGWNIFGQATGISSENGSGPVVIGGKLLSDVSTIAAGSTESIAVKSNGTVVIWGADNAGHKFDLPPDLTNAVAVAAGWDHCLVLKKDGTVIGLGTTKQPPSGLTNVVAIATSKAYGFSQGPGNDFALTINGSIVSWAVRGIDRESSLPKELTNITAIAVGGAASLALTKDGRVFGMGVNDRGQATGIKTTNYIASGYVTINGQLLTNVTAIAAGEDINLALKQDGTIAAWGGIGMFGFGDKPTVPEGLSNVVAIAAGSDYCFAITTNRAVAEKFRHK